MSICQWQDEASDRVFDSILNRRIVFEPMRDIAIAEIGSRRALTITELKESIKNILEGELVDVWVQGEISNFKAHSSGHWYLTLKDAKSQLQCACFKMQNRIIRFRPEDGLEVYARGRISVYEKRGEYRLLIGYLEPVGVGSLQLAFEQLKARLEAAGLFNPERKRTLPLMPKRVGIVTSPTGAALRDILRVLQRRNSGVNVLIAPVRVQGDGAAEEIADAIRLFNTRNDLDTLILARGGGSIEDLWAFNEEVVARAIYDSHIPVISAVGHETDFTIADFAADVRAPTPSAAAEMVAARRDELLRHLATLQRQLIKGVRFLLVSLRDRVSLLLASRGLDRAVGLLRDCLQRKDDLDSRLGDAFTHELSSRRDRLNEALRRMAGLRLRESIAQGKGRLEVSISRLRLLTERCCGAARQNLVVAAGKLQLLSPRAVLDRGYSFASDLEGNVVGDVRRLSPGDRLRIEMRTGEIGCTVDEVKPA